MIEGIFSMIAANPATASSAAGANPIDPVEFASLAVGLLVFLFFAITISYSSYKRKKEMEAEIEKWNRAGQRRRLEAMSERESEQAA